MFWISRKSFINLLEEAYQMGKSGCCDLNSEFFQDLLLKTRSSKLNFKLHTISQIQKIPSGRKIIHPLAGEGVVSVTSHKYVVIFKDRIENIENENSEFWSYPIATSIEYTK